MQEFDRHFEDMRRRLESDLFFAPGLLWAPTSDFARQAPAVMRARADLKDEGKEYVLTADVPGFEKDQVNLEVTANGLELTAKAERESQGPALQR